MKGNGKLAVAVAVVALVFGLAPGLALAADGSDAQAGTALSIDQPAKQLTTGSIPLETQSADLYISSPNSNGSFLVNEQVDVKAYTGIYVFQYGYPASNYLTFKVTLDGKTVFFGSDYYDAINDPCGVSFTPTKPGKYKIEMSGSRFSPMSESDFEATDSVTITVKDLSSVVKSTKPNYLSLDRYKKNRVKVTWNEMFTGAKVYRATSSKGKFKLVATVAGTSYVDKVNKSTDYFYKIKYYYKSGSKTTLSKASDTVGAFVNPPTAPTISKVSKASKGVKVVWKYKGECNAFFVMRATKKNGKYKFIEGFEGKSGKHSFVDKTAKSGKTYWYKVEAKSWLGWKGEDALAESVPIKVKA